MYVLVNVPMERVHDLLITGMEGGSHSSFTLVEGSWSDAIEKAGKPAAFDRCKVTDRYALEEGYESEGGGYLSDESLCRGLTTMAQDHPRHWEDFMKEDEDAVTGDVFLQCAFFGDVVYG